MQSKDAIEKKYAEALAGLAANCKPVVGYAQPVLYEGGGYGGIWLECGPLEARVYGKHAPEVARASHEVFFHHQREDGYLPCWISTTKAGSHSIQMVVFHAATQPLDRRVYRAEDQGLFTGHVRLYRFC